MKFYTLLFCLLSTPIIAQTTADFENIELGGSEFLNGSEGVTSYTSGNVALPISYFDDPMFPFWFGWSISQVQDTVTAGFGNQYASNTGSGFGDSDTYAVSFSLDTSFLELTGDARGEVVSGFYVTNGTYATLSMRNGDGIAKRFGGETGDDPDFFLLTIEAVLDDEISANKIEFYLADYRFADNSQDYIVSDWTYVDASTLGPADQLIFTLSSSDNNSAGMLTPAYFCLDNVITSDGTVNVNERSLSAEAKLYPNPAQQHLQVSVPESVFIEQFTITDMLGKVVQRGSYNGLIQIEALPIGSYVLQMTTSAGMLSKRFVKR